MTVDILMLIIISPAQKNFARSYLRFGTDHFECSCIKAERRRRFTPVAVHPSPWKQLHRIFSQTEAFSSISLLQYFSAKHFIVSIVRLRINSIQFFLNITTRLRGNMPVGNVMLFLCVALLSLAIGTQQVYIHIN